MLKRCLTILVASLLPFYGMKPVRADQPDPAVQIDKMKEASKKLDTSKEPDVGMAISPLKKDKSIPPFSGVLLSPAAVAWIIVELETMAKTIDLERKHATELANAWCEKRVSDEKHSLETDKSILQFEVENNLKTIEKLAKDLEDERENRPNLVLWTSLGVAGGIGLTLLTVYAVNQASK